MTPAEISSILALLLWALAACTISLFGDRHRMRIFWAVVACGVPVLGLVTLKWGPGVGITSLTLGVCVLLLQSLRRREKKGSQLT